MLPIIVFVYLWDTASFLFVDSKKPIMNMQEHLPGDGGPQVRDYGAETDFRVLQLRGKNPQKKQSVCERENTMGERRIRN